MSDRIRLTWNYAPLMAFALLFTGCDQGLDVEDTPEQSAKEALGVKDTDSSSRSVENQRDVIVKDTTEVIDSETGKVIKTEETETPVTITEEKTINRDVNVDTGKTKTRVE